MAANIHEEEVLGKAYDSRLMRRLLTYLRPYKVEVIIALSAIILKAGADVLLPYLVKVEIDKYLARNSSHVARSWLGSQLSSDPIVGITEVAALYVGIL